MASVEHPRRKDEGTWGPPMLRSRTKEKGWQQRWKARYQSTAAQSEERSDGGGESDPLGAGSLAGRSEKQFLHGDTRASNKHNGSRSLSPYQMPGTLILLLNHQSNSMKQISLSPLHRPRGLCPRS